MRGGQAAALVALACVLGVVGGTAGVAHAAEAATPGEEYDALFLRSLRQPSDVALAYRVAGLAVARGDYEAAIGVYERVLYYNPRLANVRLELGRLYYRLGAYESARSYFSSVANAGDLAPGERESVAAYLIEIERRLSTNQWSVYAQAGVRYQSNATYGAVEPHRRRRRCRRPAAAELPVEGGWQCLRPRLHPSCV